MASRAVIVRVSLGVLLLATAALKLYGLGTSAVPSVGWFAQPQIQLLAAEWELVLGAWLLSGFGARASWVAALITFVCFALVSGYLGAVGVASCGCLGAIKTNPWWMFGIDAAAVVLLAVGRPPLAARGVADDALRFSVLRTTGVWVGSVALVSAVLVGVGALVFGSVEVAVAKLRGETLVVTPYVDFGSGKVGEQLVATATVTNYTSEPVRLIGGTTDCSCATVDDFPISIAPGERASFRVRLAVLTNSSGQLTRNATVRTDCAARPVLQFQLGCRVQE